jgi:drug/metabolite transporter (DMT)-like permease
MPNTARGLFPLLAYMTLVAGTDVFTGNRLQSLNPVTVGALSFTFAAILLLGLSVARKGVVPTLRPLRTHRHDVIAINIMTAVVWLTLLFALKYLEPAVVSVVAFAVGPAVTVIFGRLLRRGSSILPTELVVSLVILILIGVLGWGSLDGLSSLGHIGTTKAVLGLVLGIVCGLACTGNTIYAKRLDEGGLSPLSTLAVRYFVMIGVSWLWVAVAPNPDIGPAILPSLAIAVIGVALQNYLGQVGIKYVEPITASLLDTLSPVVTFALQLFDSRLHPSALTLACTMGVTLLVALGVVARSRHEIKVSRAIAAERPTVDLPVGVMTGEH